jgi:hypothetical protein
MLNRVKIPKQGLIRVRTDRTKKILPILLLKELLSVLLPVITHFREEHLSAVIGWRNLQTIDI